MFGVFPMQIRQPTRILICRMVETRIRKQCIISVHLKHWNVSIIMLIAYKKYKVIAFLVFVLLSSNTKAGITLPRIIGDNMVLQRNKPVAIWGNASAGEKIAVKFNRQTKTTVADNSGNWKIELNAMVASDKPIVMTIAGAADTITLKNILVGEVWLCSGQSNMEYTMMKETKFV